MTQPQRFSLLPLLFALFPACTDSDVVTPSPDAAEQRECLVLDAEAANKAASTDPMALVTSPGWNLGNSFDAFVNGRADETCWSVPACTQALFTKLSERGIKCVRIPITWVGRVGNGPDYTIEAAWLNRIAEVVGYAENAGFKKIVINIHHDDKPDASPKGWIDILEASTNDNTNAAIKAKLAAMWKQIATKFRDRSSAIIYETMNEVQDGGWGWGASKNDGGKQYGILNDWQKVCLDAIRTVDQTHWVAVVGYAQHYDFTLDHLQLPTDPAGRLMVAVHYYDPRFFTLVAQNPVWGERAFNQSEYSGEGWKNEAQCREVFAKLKQRYVDQGVPCYIGEMSCVRYGDASGEKYRRYWTRYVTRAAIEAGLQPYLWDNGSNGTGSEQSGLFNRQTGEYLNDDAKHLVEDMLGVFNKSVTLQQVYDQGPCDPIPYTPETRALRPVFAPRAQP